MSVNAETFILGQAPHIRSKETVSHAMKNVVVALIPITLVSIFIFGLGAILVISVCMIGAVLGEVVARRIKGQQPTLHDGTAVLTGLLLALSLPPTAWWAVVPLYTLGGFLATAVFREFMGGIGWNRFNPALASRVFLLFGRTSLVYMAPFLLRLSPVFRPYLLQLEVVDAVSKATPLMMFSEGLPTPAYNSFLLAYKGGSLAETSVLALLLGAAYLLYKNEISWHVPISILSTVFALSAVYGADPLFQILSGGLMLGAFFMATDWVTSPITTDGKIYYGVGIGILIVFFRLFAAQYWVPVGGVAISILVLNAFVPTFDKFTRRKAFGHSVKRF